MGFTHTCHILFIITPKLELTKSDFLPSSCYNVVVDVSTKQSDKHEILNTPSHKGMAQ
jgi:hypothetical protein